jgi:dTDP-4-amino-4,6-dideoxygalactose transaminase
MAMVSEKPASDMRSLKNKPSSVSRVAPQQLSIFGGSPAFSNPLHVGRPNIGDRARFLERLNTVLDVAWLTNGGSQVQEFEKRISEILDVKHCIAMCNATVALETAHALQWQQITPVFCDVDPATHNMDPDKIEELVTPRTSAILGVHLWGRPCAIEELKIIADRHKLALLFDAAHAFGCVYRGRMIGGFGDAEILSFHATKFINCAEGGAVVTNDDDLAARIRLMKNFGFSGYDNVIYIGTNGKMNELSAAFGLANLESAQQFIEINRRNFVTYQESLADIPGLSLVTYSEADRPNYQYVVCEVNASEVGLTRDQLLAVLHAENVLARRYFYPGVHRMEPYRSYFPQAKLLLPNTEAIAERVLLLPTGTGVDSKDIVLICEIVRAAIANSEEVARVLSSEVLA